MCNTWPRITGGGKWRSWSWVFPQERSLQRAITLAFGIRCGVGRRTLTRALSFQGNTQKDGSADYKVFSRSPWQPRALFHPIMEQAITVVARCRKDLVLCRRAPGKGRRFYGKVKFTPEEVRRRSSRARWQKTKIFHGGAYREVRFKELTRIYWQGGSQKREVRLLVVAPVGYRTSKNGRK